jgi:hypothetical protein
MGIERTMIDFCDQFFARPHHFFLDKICPTHHHHRAREPAMATLALSAAAVFLRLWQWWWQWRWQWRWQWLDGGAGEPHWEQFGGRWG